MSEAPGVRAGPTTSSRPCRCSTVTTSSRRSRPRIGCSITRSEWSVSPIRESPSCSWPSPQPPSLGAITPLSVYADTATGVLAPGGPAQHRVCDVVGRQRAQQRPAPTAPVGCGSWWKTATPSATPTSSCGTRTSTRRPRPGPTRFYTDEVAGPLDIRNWVRDINVPVFLASAFGDEQTGPSFGDLLGNFDSSPSVRQIIYNGLHADGFAPQILRGVGCLPRHLPRRRGAVASGRDRFPHAVADQWDLRRFGAPSSRPLDRCLDARRREGAVGKSEDEIRVLMESGAGGTENGLPVAGLGVRHRPVGRRAGTVVDRYYFGSAGTLDPAPTDPAGTAVQFFPDPAVATTDFHAGWQHLAQGPQLELGAADRRRQRPVPDRTAHPRQGDGRVPRQRRPVAQVRCCRCGDRGGVLSEIDPDGNETRVQSGVLQASYRTLYPSSTELQPVQYGYEAGFAPLVPGEWTEARIQIPAFAHAFRAGSSIRLTINTPRWRPRPLAVRAGWARWGGDARDRHRPRPPLVGRSAARRRPRCGHAPSRLRCAAGPALSHRSGDPQRRRR